MRHRTTEGRSAVTRRNVSLTGGQLKAGRNPEGGSTFVFTVPGA